VPGATHLFEEPGALERVAALAAEWCRQHLQEAHQQDFGKPPEGRDQAPADAVKEGKRSSKSPWMGGG
jgi:hypothetical protein